MILKNATVWTGEGKTLEGGYIKIEDGKIAEVGLSTTEEGFDCEGKWITPGYIDAHTHLGVFGDGQGEEAEDCNEDTDPITPHLRAIDGVNPWDRSFEEALAAGITTVVTGVGSANPIGGDLLAMKTYGGTVDERSLGTVGIKFAFGENPKSAYGGKEQTPVTRMATAALIREQLAKAVEYKEKSEKDYDAKCEALLPLLRREVTMHAHAHRADDICTAIRIAEEFSLRLCIVHGTEAHRLTELLAKKQIPVLCGPMLCDRSKPELVNLRENLVVSLSKEGIPVSLITDHPELPAQYLSLCAQLSLRNGMSREDALKSITVWPAKILGLSHRIGTIAPGMDADLILHSEDPLALSSKPLRIIKGGKE